MCKFLLILLIPTILLATEVELDSIGKKVLPADSSVEIVVNEKAEFRSKVYLEKIAELLQKNTKLKQKEKAEYVMELFSLDSENVANSVLKSLGKKTYKKELHVAIRDQGKVVRDILCSLTSTHDEVNEITLQALANCVVVSPFVDKKDTLNL